MGGEVGSDGIDQRRRREGPNILEIPPYIFCGLGSLKDLRMVVGCRNNGLLCDCVNLKCMNNNILLLSSHLYKPNSNIPHAGTLSPGNL